MTLLPHKENTHDHPATLISCKNVDKPRMAPPICPAADVECNILAISRAAGARISDCGPTGWQLLCFAFLRLTVRPLRYLPKGISQWTVPFRELPTAPRTGGPLWV